MASSVRAAALGFKPVHLRRSSASASPSPSPSPSSLSFKRSFSFSPLSLSLCPGTRRKLTLLPLAASGEATEAEEATFPSPPPPAADQQRLETEGPTDSNPEAEADTSAPPQEENPNSAMISILNSYKEALLITKDQTKIDEIETYLLSIQEEQLDLSAKVEALTAELKTEHDRVLRISADFDNFRKRTDKEKLNLMDNVKGEVLEGLLPVLDNFERAKTQIKVETEGEKKINDSYQSIYKQFFEILTSLGVKDVETVGTAFDPMFHEAIMREESTEYEEGIIIQEFRKGFRLGDRLLRPAMVKVSAGPGPAKSDNDDPTIIEDGVLPQDAIDSREDGDDGADFD